MAIAEQFEKIKEQEWYQQLEASYEQLSPEQQSYVKWGSLAATAGFILYLTFSTIQSANSVKEEYFQKQELTQIINQANDEIRRLKGQNAGMANATSQNWKMALQGIGNGMGISPESIEVLKEAPGSSQNVIQETLLEVQVKGIALRPLTQFLYQIEHGSPPIKLKGMKIETSATDGLLDAKINLSGYLVKPEKGEKTK